MKLSREGWVRFRINRILVGVSLFFKSRTPWYNNGRFSISYSPEIINFGTCVKHGQKERIWIWCLLSRYFLENCFTNFERGFGSFFMGANDRSVSTPRLGSDHYYLQILGLRFWNSQRKICLPDRRTVYIPLWFHFISILSLQREPDMQIGTKT